VNRSSDSLIIVWRVMLVRYVVSCFGRSAVAVDQQVGDLHEGALRGELFDRIAAIQQHAGIAVDVGDLALALAVAPKAGSKVKTPWSLCRLLMSMQSGPIVPLRTGELRFRAGGGVREVERLFFHRAAA
jgi:hypothetical protein